MTETYWSLGSGLPPIWSLVGLGFSAASFFLKRSDQKLNPFLLIAGLAWIVTGLLSLPIGVLFFAMVTAAFFVQGPLPRSLWLKVLAIAGISAVGAYLAWIPTGGTIQIRPDEVASNSTFFSSSLRKGAETAILRDGLEVSALKSSGGPLWDSDTRFWSIRNAGLSMEDISWSGREVFFGPKGFIRGDALGRHIAAWANVQPRYWYAEDIPPPRKTVP